MSGVLFSQDWWQIAQLKPQLKNHVLVSSHRYRGRRYYVLMDQTSGQSRRLSPESYWIVGRMDGQQSVADLWDEASRALGSDLPTHEEVLQLLASLYQANLIKMDASGEITELLQRQQDNFERRWLAKLKSPLSIQIPLVDPNKFLNATQTWVAPMFTPFAFVLWGICIICLSIFAGLHWEALSSNVADRVLAMDNLLLMAFIYPLVKLLHELGHGYCVKKYGGEVHEMGVMLLVFVPIPYVDATASAAFNRKYKRILVAAAGIMVELFIAALAMFVWVNSEEGLVKSIAFNVVFIAGVSTVLVNGNPLLRFDGYYVFSDLLEIPNLGQRANKFWAHIVKKLFFGIRGLPPIAIDKKEALWLFWYGAASYLYRIVLMVTIVLFVAQKYFFVGVVLAFWAFVNSFIWPTVSAFKKMIKDSDIKQSKRNPWGVTSLFLATLIALFCVPLPLTTTVQGVTDIDPINRVVVGENCFISSLEVLPGTRVMSGDLLVRCENPELEVNINLLALQLQEVKAKRQGFWDSPTSAQLVDKEIERLETELEEMSERISALNIFAYSTGVWWVKKPESLEGKFYPRGSVLGYILQEENMNVLAMVEEADIDLLRGSVEHVSAKRSSNLSIIHHPQSWHVQPATTKTLVSQALSDQYGGNIVLNPGATENKAIGNYFNLEFRFEQWQNPRVEERVFLKFDHGDEALGLRCYRALRRIFLRYFDV